MKFNIDCLKFYPLEKNTLRGFVTVRVRELGLVIHDLSVHMKNESRWVGLPGKPQIKDGAVVTDDRGKTVYVPILEFEDREIRDAFSRAVLAACEECLREAAPCT